MLLQDHGLAPLSVRVIKHVQSLEADSDLGGSLSTRAVAEALGIDCAAALSETQRLMDAGCLAANHAEIDLIGPRLIDQGFAVLAR